MTKLDKEKTLAGYRGLLDRISRTAAGRDEVIRMHAKGDSIPMYIESSEIEQRVNSTILDRLKQSLTPDLRPSLLKVVEEVAHRLLTARMDAAFHRDVIADFSLTPEEAQAFERAMRVAAKSYSPVRLVIFDSYGNAPEGCRRQRDLAIIWEGFANMTWTGRIRYIRWALKEPRLRPVGVTQHEIDINEIPGLTSCIRSRPVATAEPREIQRCSACGASLG